MHMFFLSKCLFSSLASAGVQLSISFATSRFTARTQLSLSLRPMPETMQKTPNRTTPRTQSTSVPVKRLLSSQKLVAAISPPACAST